MRIHLEKVGKRFNREWIFRDVSQTIDKDTPTVILGSNGSGKSTLLKILSGFLSPSAGEVRYLTGDLAIPRDEIFRQISIAAPYISVFEELTLEEMIQFQGRFIPFLPEIENSDIPKLMQLEKQCQKQIKYFSSGMKQRVKLGLAILASSEILLLDEPVSNLDANGVVWYKELIKQCGRNRTIVICSNNTEDEFFFCSNQITLDQQHYH